MSAGGTLYFLSKYFQSTLPYGMRHKKRSPTVITVRFQSTHPLRDATCGVSEATVSRWISIHAPLTGCDARAFSKSSNQANFNPRTPYGMRLGICVITIEYSCISIHAPLTGCDVTEWEARATRDGISIHAPLTGCDFAPVSLKYSIFYFNPRTPYGMRQR